MCYAVPMKVISVKEDVAVCDFEGQDFEVGIGLLESVDVGQYLIVHTGYAIEVMDEDEAKKTLDIIREAAEVMDLPYVPPDEEKE